MAPRIERQRGERTVERTAGSLSSGRRLAGIVLPALALLGAGCGLEPAAPVAVFRVSPETAGTFEAAGLEPERAAVAAAQVEGALQLLFGTPARPGYAPLAAWAEDERDPNYGQDELDDAAFAALAVDNEVRFARPLAAVRAGAFDAVPRVFGAEGAHALWRARFAPLIAGEVAGADLHPDSPPLPTDDAAEGEGEGDDEAPFTWADEAERFWRERYPTLAESAALYQRHCVHCHGATGAGDGPSGVTLEPPPRDLRRGIFKWVAVEAGHRPRRADLLRVLERGVEGTAMPSFARLSRAEREGLVDWVRLLSLRGETELVTAALAAAAGAVTPEVATQAYSRAWARWDEAEERLAAVPTPPEAFAADAVTRGRALFSGPIAKCNTCHGDDARGDGDAIFETDAEGRRTRRKDVWGGPSRPRDLTRGVFYGGDRPADLFRRIKYGIGGTIMPAADPGLADDDIWALVAFVLALREGGAL